MVSYLAKRVVMTSNSIMNLLVARRRVHDVREQHLKARPGSIALPAEDVGSEWGGASYCVAGT